jgi:hypothetical protein
MEAFQTKLNKIEPNKPSKTKQKQKHERKMVICFDQIAI